MVKEYDLGNIKGDKGDIGLSGPSGPAGTTGPVPHLTAGNTITLPPGEAAYVSRRADSPDSSPVFDFAIPSAGKGDMLASVYDPDNRHQDIFSYIDDNGGKRPATYIIAAADSKNKHCADYLCDGEGDQVLIRQAINSLPPFGGKILLQEGTYHLDTEGITPSSAQYTLLNVTIPNVTIAGMGRNTVLKFDDSVGEADCSYQLLRVAAPGFCLHDLVIDGNSSNNSAGDVEGLRLNYQAAASQVKNCLFRSCSVCAIDSQAEQVIIADNIIELCSDGMRLQGGIDIVYSNYISECAGDAISANGGEHIISHNHISSSGSMGIYLDMVSYSQISNNSLFTQPIGISVNLSNCCQIRDNTIRRKEDSDSYGTGEYSIYLSSCNSMVVVGNWLKGKALAQDAGCTGITRYFPGTDWNITS